MTPQEFIQTQRTQGVRSIADNSFSVNYNQSCVSCHSIMELNERSEEMEYYGINSVHNGYPLSSQVWLPVYSPGIGNDVIVPGTNPYWPPQNRTGATWWSPTTGTAVSSGSIDRPRSGGATRDTPEVRERPQSTAPPVYSQPGSTSGGTSSAPPASTPTVTTQSSPASPAPSTDGGRTREGSSTVNPAGKTRNDGATRDNESNRPR
jgi:hypothetical protein